MNIASAPEMNSPGKTQSAFWRISREDWLAVGIIFLVSLLSSTGLTALVWASWLACFLSGLTMYRFGKRFFSPRVSLFVGVLYLLLPYHVSDLYERSALSEFWAFAWIPIVLDACFVVA